jgi:hypothetical protein
MRFGFVCALFAFSCVFAEEAMNQPCQAASCCPIFIDFRHTEHRGVGYQEGYTTIESFLIPSQKHCGFYPYFDFRAHIFNSGHHAFNTGIGARFQNDRVWGLNTYYDFRKTSNKKFNQIAAGFETMGIRWDFFANGYLVVGGKKSPAYDVQFSHFVDHDAYLKERIDTAMSGADAKVRYHFLKKEGWDLYFDIGPYCYFKKENAIGGQAKLAAQIANYVYVEANTSYDRLFKWIGQGIIGFSIPLGRQNCPKPVRSCHDTALMRDRLTQIPATQEIIVVDRRIRKMVAIDPATGQPYHFMFVSNLFGSNGTYQDPYASLAAAEAASSAGDIIYVYPGDGTSRNMDAGITLKNDQQLLGAGVSQALYTQNGLITIPSQTAAMPVISNAGGDAVTLAQRNTVSGLRIASPSLGGIRGIGISDARICNNRFEHINTSNTADTFAIYLRGPGFSGSSLISSNSFTQSSSDNAASAIYIQPGHNAPQTTDVCTITILNNHSNMKGYGLECVSYDASEGTIVVKGNTMTVDPTINKRAMAFEPHNTSRLYYTITNNTLSSPDSYALDFVTRDTSHVSGTVSNNSFTHSKRGFEFASGGTNTTGILIADSNEFSHNTVYDFYGHLTAGDNGLMCLRIINNTARALGFNCKNEGGVLARINIATYTGNVGPFTPSGTITRNSTCD